MGKHRPHILVTTPESLYILLTAEKSRAMLRDHAHRDRRRNSRRGRRQARLASGAVAGASRCSWPNDQAATHRTFGDREAHRTGRASFFRPNARIIDIGHRREMELAVEVPRDELGPVASNEMWAEIYDRLAELILTHRTTLVFVNTRRLSERVTHALGRASGRERRAAASRQPFASLAPERRSAAEERRTARGGGDGIARAGHRHRHGGSGVPDRIAAIHRGRAAARGTVGALGGRETQGPLLRHHARRADRVRGSGSIHSFRTTGPARNPQGAARHSGAADRRRNGRSRLAGRRSLPAGPEHLSLSRSGSQAFRRDHRQCCRMASRRSAAAAARICIAIR